MTGQMRRALVERQALIEQRAAALAQAAIEEQAAWTSQLGLQPRDAKAKPVWTQQAQIIAAYRDRYRITSTDPLGPATDSAAQRLDRARAEAALVRARRLAMIPPEQSPSTERQEPTLRL
jgi:hypothetical protein